MSDSIIVEIIRVAPALIWATVLAGIAFAFYEPLKRLLGQLTELKAFGVEAAFVKAELDEAAQTAPTGPKPSRDRVARRAERLAPVLKGASVLVVNDSPSDMNRVATILRSLGVTVEFADSSQKGMRTLKMSDFDVVLSDMRRGEIEDEGLRFLNQMRKAGIEIPVIFTVARYHPERGTPPFAFGITNRVDELLNLTFDALERRRG